jgi:hypothetical protein
MFRKVFFAILLTALVGGCQKPPMFEQEHPGSKGHPPELLGYYAAKEIRPGEPWNVYIKAKDIDGDMKYIVATLAGEGEGSFPPSEIWLKGPNRTECDGYIFMNTPPLEMTELSIIGNLKINMFIRDWAGNKSKTVTLPLVFNESAQPEKVPANWQQAANNELGYINNVLLTVDQLGPGGQGWH